MKIFLTGQKQIGKSTCINEFLEMCKPDVCGYKTLPYFEDGKRKGFYLHSLVTLDENDVIFSKDKETIEGVFDGFGTKILNASNQDLLILDEIGFLERNELKYLDVLINKIETYPNILGVLRKSNITYIETIKAMSDVIILDLDEISYDMALKVIRESFTKTGTD